MRIWLPASQIGTGGSGHLLADYAANGSAHITHPREHANCEYPLCVQRTSATAPPPLCLTSRCSGTRLSPLAPGVAAAWPARWDRSVGGFDGPFVALFPAAVHSPRRDDVYDR